MLAYFDHNYLSNPAITVQHIFMGTLKILFLIEVELIWASLMAQTVKNLPAMQKTQV